MTNATAEISGVFITATLDFVERVLGHDTRDRVLEEAGVGEQDVPANGEWTTIGLTLRIAEAASAALGDDDIGWRIGEELLRQSRETGLDAFLRQTGSVRDAFANVADYGSRMSTGRVNRVVEAADDSVVIEGHYSGPLPPSRFFCRLQAGYYAGLPSLFGGQGHAAEPACQLRGADRCQFVVRWTGGAVADTELAEASERTIAIVRQFEDLEAIAAELVSVRDTETALERIMARIGTATMAPRIALLTRTNANEQGRLDSRGFEPHELPGVRAAIERLGDPVTPWGRPFITEISGDHSYAAVAVFVPDGTSPSEAENRLLRAYAGHAISALETAAAFEAARRDRDTAHTLLDLAHELANTRAINDVADAIAGATRRLVGADFATVWLWKSDEGVLSLAAAVPPMPDGVPTEFDAVQVPALLALRGNPRPVLLPVDQTRPVNADLMQRLGVQTAAYVPVVAHEEFYGLVSVGFDRVIDPRQSRELISRLRGLSDFASAAMDNAHLFERVTYRASHDALTGLPNRANIAAVADAEAIDEATGLLFIDLDDFKQINDEHGHRIGDQVLTVIASRMDGCMRPNDTLARFAGDEFVVLVRDCPDRETLEEVARRVAASLEHPLIVEAHIFHIAASIGLAHAGTDGHDFEALLNAADAAMYERKTQSRQQRGADAHAA